MSDNPSKATPREEVERKFMSTNRPRSEQEWWAINEIERLRTEVKDWIGRYRAMGGMVDDQAERANKAERRLSRYTAKEINGAVVLANTILDRVNADPDDDLAILARQLLRRHDDLKRLWHFAGCPFDHCQTCIDDAEWIKGLHERLGSPSDTSVEMVQAQHNDR